VLHGEGDGIARSTGAASQSRFFTGPYQYRPIPIIGHNVPQEAAKETAMAVLELLAAAR